METAFWICLAIVLYTYIGYPVLLGVWARLRGRPVRKGDFRGSYSILLAAHNEEANIERRLNEMIGQVRKCGLSAEILVLADGCTDKTVAIAEAFGPPVRVLDWRQKRGKAAALSDGAAAATGDILLFADARQTWADDTIPQLLGNFADPEVGAVSGDLVLESSPGVMAGVGLYWRFEKWLRKQESRIHAQVGVTGAISGVRRMLFAPIPPGTLLDDVYWPLQVALAGHRVVHDETAKAHDRLPEKSSAEFRRKVRTLAGNFQLAWMVPRSLLPWRNPVWLAWVSRKLMRLVVPWALLGLLVTTAFLGGPHHWFLGIQVAAYLLALAGMTSAAGRFRLAGAAGSFLVLNAAAWCAFWVWISGRAGNSWAKIDYRELPASG